MFVEGPTAPPIVEKTNKKGVKNGKNPSETMGLLFLTQWSIRDIQTLFHHKILILLRDVFIPRWSYYKLSTEKG